MTEFAQCFRFNLADTLTRYVEFLSDFLQCTLVTVIQTKPETEDLFFAGG